MTLSTTPFKDAMAADLLALGALHPQSGSYTGSLVGQGFYGTQTIRVRDAGSFTADRSNAPGELQESFSEQWDFFVACLLHTPTLQTQVRERGFSDVLCYALLEPISADDVPGLITLTAFFLNGEVVQVVHDAEPA